MPELELLMDSSEVVHYFNPAVPLYVVTSDLTGFPGKKAACHWHDDIEIMYIVRGHICYNVNGELLRLDTGDAVIVNSRRLHYGFSEDGTDCGYHCIVFKPELLFNNSYLARKYLEPVVSARNIPFVALRHDEPGHLELLRLLPELARLRDEALPGCELMMLACLQRFWSLLYRSLLPRLEDMGGAADRDTDIQKAMVLFVQRSFRQKLTIADIAAAGNISRTKCCQLFKKYLSTTPTEYLNACRLEAAAKQLLDSERQITDIALSCGFNSSSYFSEVFRKVKGCTPAEYRKRV